ncbi:sodium:solute symporter family protein [Halovivax gelatinilyticus]|uniref:sodium:solute symporter family protein n=1 Tax=Halovivax gelatinilyticus TaxID=2961597 RepID=UPI0020CA8FD9|nr:sodium:solute symporter family protein [Halovivax gelatinilyticus]
MVSLQAQVALATIGIYILVVLGVGYQGWRVGKLEIEDWMAADRGLGITALTFTVAATIFSAFAFLGAGGITYMTGLPAIIGFTLQLFFAGVIFWVLGSRMWILGAKYGYISPSDFLADFYDSKPLSLLASGVLILFSFPYVALQLTGAGIIFEVATEGVVSFEVGAAILLAAGVIYVWLGGLRALAWTDIIQGVFMLIAIWLSAILIMATAFQGPTDLFAELSAEFQDHFLIPGPGDMWTPEFTFTWFIIAVLGQMMLPQMFLRYFGGGSPATIKWSGVSASIYLFIFYLAIPFIALGGLIYFPEISDPDNIVPEMLYEFAPAWFASIVVAGAIAAAMSTKDSQLHAVAVLLTRDWYEEFVADGEIDERKETRFAQILVPIIAIIAYVIAIQEFAILFWLLTFALEGAAQLAPIIVGALIWDRASAAGAIAGLSTGVILVCLLLVEWIAIPSAIDVGFFSGFYALLANSIVFVVVSYVTSPVPQENVERIQGYLDGASNQRWDDDGSVVTADD